MKGTWVIASLVLMAGMGLGSAAASAEQVIRQAQIASLSGQVEWLKAGSETWQAASVSQQLANGDKIRTSQAGQVSVSLDEGSTIDLYPGSEFSIQTLSKDPTSGKTQSIFGIARGKLMAKVTPVPAGSAFEFETPSTTVRVPAGGADPTIIITVNPDGSVSVSSKDGTVELSREGDNKLHIELAGGQEGLVEYDPATGVLRITSLTGTFDVVGPDNAPITLADGDTVTYSGGAATFVPATPPVDAPAADTLAEPVSGG